MNLPKCKLCISNDANQKNSHIITKFLGNGLFENLPNKKTFIIKHGIKQKFEPQDTIKEDHILCSDCEKKIGKVETYMATRLEKLKSYQNFPNEYKINSLGSMNFLEDKNINPYIFKLFIYSQIWRVSISSDYMFQAFIISEGIKEDIRIFLNDNLLFMDYYNNSPKPLIQTPNYHFTLHMKEDKLNTIKGGQCAYSANNIHVVMLGDFIIQFYSVENTFPIRQSFYSNKYNSHIIVILESKQSWQDIMINVVR